MNLAILYSSKIVYNGVVNLMPSPRLISRDDETTDETLLKKISCGDSSAFACLVRRHTDKFYKLAYRILVNPSDAEDVVQEAFLKLWQCPYLWSDTKNSKFTTWFYRVISNRCIDLKRKQIPMQMNEDFDIKQEQQLDDELHKKQQKLLLESLLLQLPERQRLAIILCFQEELHHKEAAEIMDISTKALESLLMRGKSTLKEKAKLLGAKS